jgi:outer membrane lipoprotein carrier protein
MTNMQRNLFTVLALPALLLAACGRADTGEASPDTASRGQVESPVPAAQEPAPGSDAAVMDGTPAAELPIEGAPAPSAPAGRAPGGAPAATPQQAQQPAPGAASAEEILRRVERTYQGIRSMEADFVQQMNVPLLGTNQRSQGKLYQRRPDRFLMRFTDPAGDVIVADGRHFWMYTPSVDRTQVLRTRLGEGGAQADLQQQFVSNPTQRFASTLNGTETVDGRATQLLTLVPRGRSQYRQIRVWVDQADHLVRRFEMTEENESVRRVELRNIRLNPTLSDALFQFTPPAGTQVFDQ